MVELLLKCNERADNVWGDQIKIRILPVSY